MSETTKPSAFTHLRLHTEFSITDSLIRINPLVKRVTQLEMPAVAITDLANLFGLIKFYTASERAGVKPICGCDVRVLDEQGVQSHLVLLVKNQIGYLNLTQLISDLYTEAEGIAEPEISLSSLRAYSEGLIALSGAQHSNVGQALLDGELGLAEQHLQTWQAMFPDSFYLELQRVGKADEEAYIAAVMPLAEKLNCPVVATNDVRFLQQDEFEAHEVRVCINDRRTLDDPRRPRNYTDQQFLKSAEDMIQLFQDIPEAIENAVEIGKRCTLSLELDQPSLPNYPVPDDSSLEDYLCRLSTEGLETRLQDLFADSLDDAIRQPYAERLEMELGIINQMGFAGYFLIVMEFIQWAKKSGIPVGPGRGSGAGSIVAYALGITDLDPLRYDLLFERFLNPERVSMPDFDVDFCMEGRDRVIQHVAELYGKEAVAQIITFGTMAAKAVVRDVARVQGKPYALADKLSKLIPFEPGMTLKKAFEVEPQLGEFVDSDEDAQEIMEMAYKLEGITRNVGKHAGGVVIAPTRLTDFTPLYCEPSGEGLVTQFDKNDVETAGLVKFDFLGLRTLTIIDWAVKMINAQLPEDKEPVDINHLPLDDENVYKLMQRAETTAVFQLESRGMKELIKRLAPNCFEDIIALVALFRPGPLQSGMVDDFIDRKHGRTRVEFPHPELEPVLSNTYGVILYQEQVMQIAQVLASYTLGGADILRKAMGKKNPDEMAKQRVTFMQGAERRGVDSKQAGAIFDLMEKFAGYGFNKSHSAAYALVSYQTAWLKTHYPAFFMAAVLSADMQNTDKIVTLIDECKQMGLKIVPPDVNMGQFNFTVNEEGDIVYGLGAIKGLGAGPVACLLEARTETPFTSLLDLCQRVDPQTVNKRTMEALVRSGALDKLIVGDVDYSRAALSIMLPDTMQAAEQSSRNKASGVEDLFGEIAPAEPATEGPGGNLEVRPWSEQQRLQAEKESLGLYLSGHPINEYLPELKQLTRNRLVALRPERGVQLVGGTLYDFRIMKGKNGSAFAFVTLDDGSARFELSLFKEFETYRHLLQKDTIVIVECTVEVDDRNGGVRGRVKRIMTLQEARKKFACRLKVKLRAETLPPSFCDHLESILQPYRKPVEIPAAMGATGTDGEMDPAAMPAEELDGCKVQINYERADSQGCIMFGQEWCVSPSEELIQQLRMEFGRDTVELDYRQAIKLN